jgi:hypothetical protein
MTRVMEKLEEYDRKGVPNIRLIDPRLKTMSRFSAGALHEVRGDGLSTVDSSIDLTREGIFQE